MAEDSDKNPGKIIKDQNAKSIGIMAKIREALQEAADKNEADADKTTKATDSLARINKEVANNQKIRDDYGVSVRLTSAEKLEKLNGIQERLLKQEEQAAALEENGQNELASQIREQIAVSRDAITKNDGSLKNLIGANNTVGERILQKTDRDLAISDKLIIQGELQNGSFKGMVEQMKEDTKSAEMSDDMIEKALLDLGPTFGGELDPFFTEANDQLQKISAAESEGIISQAEANEYRKELLDATTDREKEREAMEAAELQSMALTQLGDKFSRVGEKFGEFGKGAVKGAGLLGGLIALVMGVVDPELFAETVIKLTTGFTEIIQGILAFFSGDFETAKTKIGDNILLFGGVILGLALYFGGPLITAFGGIFTKLAKVVKAIKVFRVFMVSTFVPTMIASLTSMGSMMGFAAGSLAIVLAPVLAIVAVVGLLYAGFKALNSNLGEGAGMMDTLKVAALYLVDFLSMLVNGITFIPRKLIGFLGPRVAKFLFGDDFDTSGIEKMAAGLKTNRGAEAAAEIKLKNDKAAAEKKLEEEMELPANTTGIDLQTSGEDLEAAQLAAASGGGQTVNAPQITTQASATTNSSTTINHSVMSPAALGQAVLIGRA